MMEDVTRVPAPAGQAGEGGCLLIPMRHSWGAQGGWEHGTLQGVQRRVNSTACPSPSQPPCCDPQFSQHHRPVSVPLLAPSLSPCLAVCRGAVPLAGVPQVPGLAGPGPRLAGLGRCEAQGPAPPPNPLATCCLIPSPLPPSAPSASACPAPGPLTSQLPLTPAAAGHCPSAQLPASPAPTIL